MFVRSVGRNNFGECFERRINVNISVGTIVNDKNILRRILMRSDTSGCDNIYTAEDVESAAQGWNFLLRTMDCDVAVLCHQDIYFPPGWFIRLNEKLNELPSSWVVAGFFGVNEDGRLCGKIRDMRIPLMTCTKHELPMRAISIDGCCMCVNKRYGLRFSEELKGFDLYDTFATLRAREIGTAWIIDCLLEHYTKRLWEWMPDKSFIDNWEWLKKRFPNEKVASTCCTEDWQLEGL